MVWKMEWVLLFGAGVKYVFWLIWLVCIYINVQLLDSDNPVSWYQAKHIWTSYCRKSLFWWYSVRDTWYHNRGRRLIQCRKGHIAMFICRDINNIHFSLRTERNRYLCPFSYTHKQSRFSDNQRFQSSIHHFWHSFSVLSLIINNNKIKPSRKAKDVTHPKLNSWSVIKNARSQAIEYRSYSGNVKRVKKTQYLCTYATFQNCHSNKQNFDGNEQGRIFNTLYDMKSIEEEDLHLQRMI